MRKTILIAATACLLMVSGVYAENRTTNESTETILNVKDLAISSFCKAILQGDIDTVKSLIELG
jgi:hypothetical protein